MLQGECVHFIFGNRFYHVLFNLLKRVLRADQKLDLLITFVIFALSEVGNGID